MATRFLLYIQNALENLLFINEPRFENFTVDKDDDDDSLTTVIVPYERGVILDQFVAVDNEQAVTETRLGDDIY
jgi:hypothetical protein